MSSFGIFTKSHAEKSARVKNRRGYRTRRTGPLRPAGFCANFTKICVKMGIFLCNLYTFSQISRFVKQKLGLDKLILWAKCTIFLAPEGIQLCYLYIIFFVKSAAIDFLDTLFIHIAQKIIKNPDPCWNPEKCTKNLSGNAAFLCSITTFITLL